MKKTTPTPTPESIEQAEQLVRSANPKLSEDVVKSVAAKIAHDMAKIIAAVQRS